MLVWNVDAHLLGSGFLKLPHFRSNESIKMTSFSRTRYIAVFHTLLLVLHSAVGRNIFLSSSKNKNDDKNGDTAKIIGGSDVAVDKYPWFASGLDDRNERGCGGMLIASEYVLSAAHCNESGWTSFEIGALCTNENNCNQVRGVYCVSVCE